MVVDIFYRQLVEVCVTQVIIAQREQVTVDEWVYYYNFLNETIVYSLIWQNGGFDRNITQESGFNWCQRLKVTLVGG